MNPPQTPLDRWSLLQTALVLIVCGAICALIGYGLTDVVTR